LVEDERALLEAVTAGEVCVTVEWWRTSGIATVLVELVHTLPSGTVSVCLRMKSTTSAPMGCVRTDLAAPVYDDEHNAPRFSIGVGKDLATAIAQGGAEGAFLVGEPTSHDAANRQWEFSSGGWLIGVATATHDILLASGGQGGGRESVSSSSGMHSPLTSTQRLSDDGTNPEIYTILTDDILASLTCRIYRLDHMRRPHEYVRTLHSWLDSAAFNGLHGFISSVVAADIRSPRVYVCVLHLECVRTTDAPGAIAFAEPSALQNFATLERLWKSMPIDLDSKGRPCFERLSRVIIDTDCIAPPAVLRRALQASKLDYRIGHVEHITVGFPNTKPSKLGENCNDRTDIENVLLETVALADPATLRRRNSTIEPSSATSVKSQVSFHGNGSTPPGGMKPADPMLLAPFVSEVLRGALWA
jgi:hypothetical protein